MDEGTGQPGLYTTRGYRLVSMVLGALFMGAGAYVLYTGPSGDTLQLIGSALLIVLGVNLVLSGWAARASWLSRIGPLP
jgi:hypothetical protein